VTALVELVDRVVRCLVSDLHTRDPIVQQSLDLCGIDPVWSGFYRNSNHTRGGSFITSFSFCEGLRRLHLIALIELELREPVRIVRFCIEKSLHFLEGRMSVVDTLDHHFLILDRVHTPSPTDDADITLADEMPSEFERPEAVLYLANWVEVIELRAHDGRFVGHITLREIGESWAKYTLPRTSPKLREQRDHRNSGE